MPLLIGQLALDGVLEFYRFILNRSHRVPHEDNDVAFVIFLDPLVHDLLTEIDAVPTARGIETEIHSEYRREISTRPLRLDQARGTQQRHGMLAGQGMIAGNTIKILQQLHRFRRRIGSNGFLGRYRRGPPEKRAGGRAKKTEKQTET